jgi:hypothetical protein
MQCGCRIDGKLTIPLRVKCGKVWNVLVGRILKPSPAVDDEALPAFNTKPESFATLTKAALERYGFLLCQFSVLFGAERSTFLHTVESGSWLVRGVEGIRLWKEGRITPGREDYSFRV